MIRNIVTNNIIKVNELSPLHNKFYERLNSVPVIERQMINNERYYTVSDVNGLFPSVTTVLSIVKKDKLDQWTHNVVTSRIKKEVLKLSEHPDWKTRKDKLLEDIITEATNIPIKRRDTAVEFGNKAHNIIDEIIKRDIEKIKSNQQATSILPPIIKSAENDFFIECFEKWKIESKLTIIAPETLIFSKKFKYAGAMDAIAINTGPNGEEHLVAIDWKTTNSLQPEHALQVAAYAHALQEMVDLPVKEAWVVRFDKKQVGLHFEYKLANVEDTFTRFEAALKLWKTYKIENQSFWKKEK